MKIKKIITGGCSFSRRFCDYTWPHILQKNLQDIEFIHTGFPAQGQEMIQKKVSNKLINEIKHTSTEEICVMVMWSGTQRKSFYINSPSYIQELADNWIKNNKFGLVKQLLDLNDNISPDTSLVKLVGPSKWDISYNKNGGWYTAIAGYNNEDCALFNEYTKSHGNDLPATITSLENIIMLQNLCKVKKIKFYQSFFMSNVYDDILKFKDDLNMKYLFDQLDQDSIISTEGIFDYLKKFENYIDYFEEDKSHPNQLGHTKWVDNILLPKLAEKGFFNED